MEFLIQTINGKIVHDFSFVLIEHINFSNWYYKNNSYTYTLSDVLKYDKEYIPIGTVEFVTQYLSTKYNKHIKPKNVPECLFKFANRTIFNGTEKDIVGRKFVKSNDKIKSFTEICESAPVGNYQISDVINIESEWRGFVYNKQLVGLNNYSGDFKLFPDLQIINLCINSFVEQPIAYTIDFGINEFGTFVIEVHDFFSCGLYGFSDQRYYMRMLVEWFHKFIKE